MEASLMDGQDRLAPGWWVRLHGEMLDLEALEEAFSDETLEVVRYEDRFYLRAADFATFAADDSAGVDRRGTEIVRILNAAAKVSLGNHRSVSIGAAAWVHEDGSIQHTVHAAASIALTGRLRVKVSTTGEKDPEQSQAERIALRGLADEDVSRALSVFEKDDVDYRDLIYVFEIIQDGAGARVHTERWATKKEIRRFKHTANSPTVLGEEARHGTEATESPPDPMPFPEAKELVRRLLLAWLSEDSS